jgi:hypothetical protein
VLLGDYEDAFYLLGEGGASPVEVERVQGGIVFLGDALLLNAAQNGELQRELRALLEGGQGVAWVEGTHPAGGARRRIHALSFDATGRTGGNLSFNFAGQELRLPQGCLVARSEDGNALVMTCEGAAGELMSFGPVSSEKRFALPVQRVELGVGGSAENGNISFDAALPINAFEPWVRYFFPRLPSEVMDGEDEIGAFRYRVLAGGDGGVVGFRASFNPARPFDSARNSLVLTSGETFTTNFLSTVGRAITLTSVAGESGFADEWDPALKTSYTVLSGAWQLGLAEGATGATGATGEAVIDLMLGLSGVEYGKIPNHSYMSFVPGGPAYAPYFLGATASAPYALTGQCPGSDYPVTTSWLYLLDEANVSRVNKADGPIGLSEGGAVHFAATGPVAPYGYYSQPETAGLFTPDANAGLLRVLELRAAQFPPGATGVFGAPQAGFPAAPYAGVQPSVNAGGVTESAALYKKFETQILSTARSQAILQMNANAGAPMTLAAYSPGPVGMMGATAQTHSAVTPQGLLSTFSADYSDWEKLLLAITGGGAQTLSLANIHGQLQSALLTNQLFLVVSAFDLLQKYCDIEFGQLVIGGWTFDLSTLESLKGTIMIIKFAERDLESLISDLSLWTMAASFNSDTEKTQQTLLQIVTDAKNNVAKEPDLSYFVNTVLANNQSFGGRDTWNGILFLNCKVPPSEFPPELRGLAAGIEADKLRAHHLGVNLAPFRVEGGQLTVKDSSIFGLILYDSPTDLVYQSNPYDYKVLSLHVLFANSEVTGFSSSVELLVAELFGEKSSLTGGEHGDNLILYGVMQKHDDKDSYTFTVEQDNIFKIDSRVLDRVIISKAQFITLPAGGGSTKNVITSRFLFWGTMQFKALAELDLFSFGPPPDAPPENVSGLSYSNLYVTMSFETSGTETPTKSFAFVAGETVFDLSASTVREGSLYQRFPLHVTGMVQSNQTKLPSDLGYIFVDSPLPPGALGTPWFGLVMSLNLGGQGSLAAKTGFFATLLASWSPGTDAPNAAIGLSLPGSGGGQKSLTIQGPLKLTLGGISLLDSKDAQGGAAYMMRFQNIALSFLTLKFPPGGQTNILLFGDPDPASTNSTLGWYVAYKKDSPKEQNDQSARALFRAESRLVMGEGMEQIQSDAGGEN